MALKSILGVEKSGIAVVFIFYLISGIAQLIVIAMSAIPPIGVLAITCLIAAYGLVKMRKWAVWLVTILLFPEITFAAISLYASIMQQQSFFPNLGWLLFNLMLVIYVIATLVASVYILAERQDFH
ncbi:MAG: hypothetical protein OEX77_01575 [Candidatus Bathyarchaeota archaeon]|nr:hypothetical protein [Candidatus Bathyarchaeota archaeon]MDH5733123.1 hypothetical protein [Candidatus Bathyarchaeota archaeon]